MDEPPAETGGGGGGAAAEGPVVQVDQVCLPSGAVPLRLLEWKVKPGSLINVDSVLALAVPIAQEKDAEGVRLPEKKVKADRAGVVKELCCQVGQVLPPGGVIVKIEECSHPIVMKGLCAECGQDLTQLQSANGKQQAPISTATVSMVHSVPELMVSSEQAEQLGREDQQRLHRNKKLVLMVDLDQTLIHTTEQHCHRMSNKGIFHFQLGRGEPMLHTRLRPHCKEFLEKIAKLYELHVFTFGSRLYAHTIAGFLDPEKKLFSHRILSRDECIDPFSKTGNLRNLFPCGDSMVCIIDDREDVWKFAPNLITVKKYTYFQGTGDINAPPGSREAQMAKKGGPLSRLIESGEPSGLADEQNNGLRRKTKDHGKEESTSSTQGKTTNELTHPPAAGGDVSEAQGKELGTEVSSLTENKEDDERTLVSKNTNANSSAPDHKANNLDFDLSSDSDSDSISDKPLKTDSDSEGNVTKDRNSKQELEETAKEGEIKAGNSSEGVALPDTNLDNGCSDKQEPETESQNSEQSGVTTGEEILDHNMEDEEEEDIDQDDHLIYLEEVLERIHAEYFTRYDRYLKKEVPETPDIRKIVPELKGKTLEGTTLVFSGLYPTNYPMERTREYYHAKALGANIGKSLIFKAQDPNRTTHLIAARAGTEKVRQAQACKHLHVVNPDWLWSCLERWERVDERLYPLKEDYSKMPRSNSPAAFIDAQGSVKQPVFQPIPVQARAPPPPPEIRTYDSVTGKLIRRGPPAARPSPYLQASPSDPSTLRGSSEDEQPGPSRRDRQPSMSETMPLYTLCKEDLDSMDKEVDDILGEESDNDESESQAKDKAKKEEGRQKRAGLSSGLGSQALGTEEQSQPTAITSMESQSHSQQSVWSPPHCESQRAFSFIDKTSLLRYPLHVSMID
ncbi:RNA polymerase II subunit A C-terminal domain phosphatase isoform X2 [Boleophthalmus pectinirostris]|uniref:RNA polymerase II subunit A C-terminal domain phosphatase isoform X2 n=1 Tax=Boleophthalmus pectinirostris TaxID=150288 RepID=UPI00242FEBFB|nr:RNA polymerase II subunit A C-terminal domain phosphatase isoform X2 [Boleophthalmus pectinirostris]